VLAPQPLSLADVDVKRLVGPLLINGVPPDAAACADLVQRVAKLVRGLVTEYTVACLSFPTRTYGCSWLKLLVQARNAEAQRSSFKLKAWARWLCQLAGLSARPRARPASTSDPRSGLRRLKDLLERAVYAFEVREVPWV
jgi:hypothetical protein